MGLVAGVLHDALGRELAVTVEGALGLGGDDHAGRVRADRRLDAVGSLLGRLATAGEPDDGPDDGETETQSAHQPES